MLFLRDNSVNVKPTYEKITQNFQQSFTARLILRENRPLLSQAWHFHPELEICYTSKSKGKRFVGNHISDYKKDDLVLFGTNLPHGFTTDQKCRQVVIQFKEEFMSQSFLSKPELWQVRELFSRSRRGLVFEGETKKKSIRVIKKMMKSEGFRQIIYLFELLNLMATSTTYTEICTEEYALSLSKNNLVRIKKVYDYIIANFRKKVKIAEVAALINLTEAAFYKFIKKHTQKTFTQIINEFRVSHASKLLMTTDKTIAEICFDSGYNNISYFNRKFKKIVGQSPKDFKCSYLERS